MAGESIFPLLLLFKETACNFCGMRDMETSTDCEYFETSKADVFDRQAQERRLLCNESTHIFTLKEKPLTSST